MTQNALLPIDFLFVDDDPINNMICQCTVEILVGKVTSHSFTSPELALEFISATFTVDSNRNKTVLLLDINMPVMSGWEFLERFDNLDAMIKKQIHVYILSSSVDERDRLRSYANKNVKEFLTKPLSNETILQITNGWIYPDKVSVLGK